MVPKRFHKWLKVFRKQESERMPVCKTWDHAIDLQEEFVPRKGRIYSLSRIEKEEVQAFMDSQLKKGYIQPSKSPQTLPVMFVLKKDGKRRMVQDYQYVNKFTVKNSYPLLLISDLVDNMGTKRVFTKMDLRWGYNNIRIKEGDEWKAAFTTHIGSFEPVVMFFGLTNSLATFQTMMNDIFQDLINKGDVATFIDDVLVGTETEEGHDELVKEILRRLEEHDLYIKPEKCEWKVREVRFLRVVIGPDGIKIEKEKVRGVLEHRLVRKQERWNWGGEQEEAFRRLKEIFTSEPVLAAPDLDKEIRVKADALDYATGEVLSMKCEDEKWRPVAYISKSLSDTEKNYKIHDKEMLAVIRCLKAWRHFLEGAWIKFEVWTDHKNLEYFMSSQKLNRHQARWALFLSRFDFKLVHVPGTKMGKADGLSRRPDWQEGVGKENEDRTLVKKE